jgi:hypothetical protein
VRTFLLLSFAPGTYQLLLLWVKQAPQVARLQRRTVMQIAWLLKQESTPTSAPIRISLLANAFRSLHSVIKLSNIWSTGLWWIITLWHTGVALGVRSWRFIDVRAASGAYYTHTAHF